MTIALQMTQHKPTNIQTEEREDQGNVFTMGTPNGVYKLLREKHHIAARRFSGDFKAADLLLDLGQAVAEAQLTGRQEETIALLFEFDLTQQEAAQRMGIAQHTVSANLHAALKKIARVYHQWGE